MSLFEAILSLGILIIISAVISAAEMSLAGARKIKLQSLVNDGDARAQLVLELQSQPGRFITVVQIGLNMVAIFRWNYWRKCDSPLLSPRLNPTRQCRMAR